MHLFKDEFRPFFKRAFFTRVREQLFYVMGAVRFADDLQKLCCFLNAGALCSFQCDSHNLPRAVGNLLTGQAYQYKSVVHVYVQCRPTVAVMSSLEWKQALVIASMLTEPP